MINKVIVFFGNIVVIFNFMYGLNYYYFWCSRFEFVKFNIVIKLIFLSKKELIIKVCNGKIFIIFIWYLMLKLY